jgi:O-antigen/teichoic acid export membrane protein
MVLLTPSITRLRTRALVGSAWTIFGFGSQKLVQLISNLILTRLLFPEAFGLMTLASVLLIGLGMFSDIGIKPSIVQHPRGASIEFLNTAWTMQVIRGFVVWGGACLLAYPAALLYHQPVLFPLICVLGSTAAINGFSTTALAVREKSVDFSAIVVVQTLGSVATLIVTTTSAWLMHSVWSLAFGAIAGSLLNVVIGYVVARSHRHRFQLHIEPVRSMFRFGQWILYSTIATYLCGQGLRAIQAGLISITTFGVLSIAQMVAWMPGELTSQLISTVGFASLAEINVKGGDFFNAVRRMRAASLFLATPIFFFLSLGSDFIFTLLYDDRYREAINFLPILAFSAAIGIVPLGYQNAILALGKSKEHFWIVAYLATARIFGITFGFWLHGIYGMLIGDGVATASLYLVAGFFAYRAGILDFLFDIASIGAIILAWSLIFLLHG